MYWFRKMVPIALDNPHNMLWTTFMGTFFFSLAVTSHREHQKVRRYTNASRLPPNANYILPHGWVL